MPKNKSGFVTELGWSVDTGISDKTSHVTYPGQIISGGSPFQIQLQHLDNQVVILSQQIKAIKDALINLGLIEA